MDLIELRNQMENSSYDNSYIDEVVTYGETLQNKGYSIVFDMKHLSLLCGITSKELYAYYIMKERLYKQFEIPKQTGGYRLIIAPSENLKYIQRWILDNILNKIRINKYAMGFVSKRSIVTNAAVHVGKECVVNLDIKDFFPSISFQKVYSIFSEMGYSKHLSMFFSGITTYNDELPQGAPTSPLISNIVCDNLDKRFASLAEHINASYTRYADDITFSGNNQITKYIKLIKRVINDEGFQVNHKKLRVHHQYHRQMVTGLIVNKTLSVPRETKKYLRQQIYYSKKFGVSDNLRQQKINKTNYREHLYGLANFIKMVEEFEGKRFLEKLDKLDWES